MSGIFGGGGDGGASAQIAQQREQIAKQEAQMNQQQSDLAMRSQAALRARQRGGQRMLLSGVDEEGGKTTLGA